MAEREPKSPSIIAQHAAGASNPAGPLGLQQTEQAAHDVAAGKGPQSGSLIGQYAVDQGTTDGAARAWYTGANMEGVSNGWDTGFMAEAFKQYDEMQSLAAQEQDATQFYNWFDRDDATGVATWDDEDKGVARGDVYNDGKKVGNVFKDFDEKTANVMMAEFTLDGKTKQKIFADPDRDRWLGDEVATVLDQNSELAKNVKAAVEFQGNVDERQEAILEGKSETAIVGAGAAGGAATGAGVGATIGSIVPGAGTAAGATVGGLVGAAAGGLGAWLNRDQLSEQVARAQEITSLAGKKYGEMEAFSVGVKEWSGVGMRMISPTSNLVQGLADGERGDGESGFYAVDENGQRTAGKLTRAADVGASLADAVMQFSNPVGVAAYLTATGGHVAGQTAFMAQTGAGWNDRIGGFDDYEGSKEWAAAIGNVGIDVVQMGMAGAVVRAGAASRAAFGVSEPTVVGRVAAKAREKLMPWRAGEVVEHKTIQGMRFGLDEAGVAVTRRPTLELLAPSEAIRYVNTAWRARSRVALGTKPGHDDFYRAALETAGGNRVGQAIVTGWAEGAEEGVQAVLEPVSFSADVDAWQVMESVLYGAAAGMGMGLGSMSAQATNDQVLYSRANTLSVARNGEELTRDQWKSMDADQKKRLATASPDEAQQIADTMRAMQRLQSFDKTNTSPISAVALDDLSQSLFARDAANANPNRDNVMVLAGMTADRITATDADGNVFIDADALPAHAGATSIFQALVNVTNSQLAMAVVAEDTERQMAALQAELGSATEERATEIQAQLQELTAELDMHERTAAVGNAIRRELTAVYDVYRQAPDVATAEQAIDRFNQIIRDAFTGDIDVAGQQVTGLDAEAARRSVEILVTRHPDIATDSFMLVMPQASKALSRANAHGVMQVHQSTLLAPGADHDGDTEVSVNFARLPQASIDALRAGGQYLARTGDNETEAVSVTVDPPDGEKYFIRRVSAGLNAPSVSVEWSIAQDTVQGLVDELVERYTPHLPVDGLTRVLADFRTDLTDGNPDARLNLANGLFGLSPAGMRAAAIANGNTPEIPWLMQRITLAWEKYLTSTAALSHDLEFTPKDVDADLTEDKAFLRANAVREAMTDGQTAYVITQGNSPVRESQKLHYSVYRAAVDMAQGDLTTELFQRFVRLYAELGSNLSQSELTRVRGRNATEKRVASWLQAIFDEAQKDPNTRAPNSLMMLANTRVQDVRLDETGSWAVYDGDISLLQLLLRQSVAIDRQQHRNTLATDDELQRKLYRLERLSRRDATEDNRSTTAQLALKEVFGSYQIHDLLGDSAKYLGPHLTLNQLVAGLANRTEESRHDQLYRWRRKAPYVMHEHVGNPPYSVEELTSGNLSSYKVLVDTIAAAVQTKPREMRKANEETRETFKLGINNLRALLEEFRSLNSEQLGSTDDIAVLRALMESNPQVARLVADLIPDAAKLGAFALVDGRPVAARWVEEMLVMPADKAAVTYVVHTRIAEWNQLGGNIDLDGEGTGREPGRSHEHPRSYHKIKSRLLQTFAQLAAQPDGIELDRLVMAMKAAPSVEALEEQLNNDPAWRGDRAELLLFADDVAAYEADPRDIWSANLPGTLQREAITNFAERTTALSTAMAKFATQHATERTLLKAILTYDADNTLDRDRASEYHRLLELSIRNRGWMSDHLGPAVRDRFTEKVQDGIVRMHDKGTADAAVAPFGEALVTVDEFGVKQSVFQTADALTSYDAEDILSNPTKLAEGPVRVGLADGSTVVVDLTTVKGAAEALLDPATNAFAKQVLFPTARDVNQAGTLSTYLNVGHTGLKSMLEEADFRDLFEPKGSRLSVGQAHKYISMVEAAVRRDAIEGSEEEQAKAYFPIQSILNEFVVAYTHRPGAESKNRKQVRDQLVVDVATVLQQVSALNAKAPELVTDMVELVKATLKDRFSRSNTALASSLQTETEKALDDAAILETEADLFSREIARITTAMEQATDQAQLDMMAERLVTLNRKLNERLERMKLVQSDDSVLAAINMYTLTGDPIADTERKGAILRLLGSGNRVDKFQGPYHLINRLNTVLAKDRFALSDPDVFDTEEWSELGLWAATVYLAEISNRAGSGIKLTPLVLGQAGERIRRYYDASWSYLLDGFLNTQVLSAAEKIRKQAKWAPDFTAADVAGTIETGLLNEKKLGFWTELIVPASLKAQQVLDSASVGLAIPVGGDLPKEAAAYVGAGRRTFKTPGPEMLTTATFTVDVDGDMAWTDEAFFKLNNHFAASVVLRDAAGTEVDLLPSVGLSWLGEETVAASPYKVVSRSRLDKAIADALDAGTLTGQVSVEVAYFDVDTMPFTREWANNVYFEGVGREADTGTAPGLLAEMFFAPGAISKEAQQNPLNMATKGGAGYRATPVTELETTELLEQGHSIANVLRAKANHMWKKTYDVGQPLAGDANSLYKLMTQRHVVVGTNLTGDKEVWWAGKAIEWQSANAGQPLTSPDFPLRDAQLVPLTDSQAQTLLGEPGNKGLPGVTTLPRLNLGDLDVLPELTPEYLAERGLTRLGETSTLRQSPFAGKLPLMNVQWSGDRDPGLNTRYEAAIEKYRGFQLQVRNQRMDAKGFNIAEINDRNAKAMHRMLGVEGLATMFAKLGVPFNELRDLRETRLTEALATKLTALTVTNPSSVVWQHLHGQSSDPARGVLSDTTIRDTDGFSGAPQPTWPTYEDIVVVDLDTFLDATRGNYVLAYDQAIDAIRTYTRTGATIVLGGSKGNQRLRADLAAHLMQGGEGYTRMAESAHFFAPASPDTMAHLSELALDSTLTSSQVFTGTSLVLTHNSDRYSSYGSSENATFWDLRPGQPVWRGESVTLLPTQIGTMYGIPVKGLGPNDQETGIRTQVLELLRSPEGRAHIKRLGGDPVDAPVYRNENGVEEFGIRSLDQAMDRLQSLLESNRTPLTVGEELMIGDLIPTVGTDGSILFVRVGFQLPKAHKLLAQLQQPMDPDDPVTNPGRIAIATDELQQAWTTKPPAVIEALDPDPLAGASVRVKYDLARYGKAVTENDGWKTVRSPMPNDLAGPAVDLGANGLRVNSFSSQKSPESKQAVTGKVNHFGWAFALSGIDFRADMVEFFLGAKQRTAEEFASDWNEVRTFLDEWASRDHGLTATQIARLLSEETWLATFGPHIQTLSEELLGGGFQMPNADDVFATPTPNERLAHVLLASLMAPRVDVDQVIGTSGLLSLERLDDGAQVQLMPDIFTAALNDFSHPELREMLFDRVNARFQKGAAGERVYQLSPDWTFLQRMEHPETGTSEWIDGSLQISLEYPADENPVNYVQAGVRASRQGVSQHVAFVGYETLGMRTATERAARVEQQLFEREGLADMDDDGGFWRMLRNVPTGDNPSYSPWRTRTRLQRLEIQESAAKMASYLKPIDTKDWTEGELAAYRKVQDQILTVLFGNVAEAYRVEVDYMVRQVFGLPEHRENQPDYVGKVSPSVALQGAAMILDNVNDHMVPTYAGVVPVPHHALMAAIKEANEGNPKGWAPRLGTGRKKQLAKNWREWVEASFGQVMASKALFDSTFAQDMNGFMHTWQSAHEEMGPSHVALDQLREQKLFDIETNSMLASLDPSEEARLTQPVIFETMRATLDAITGQEAAFTREAAATTPDSELAKRIEKHVQWRATKKMPKQQQQSVKSFRDEGSWYLHSSRDTHNFFHNVVNLSVGMRLLNPALWVSAVFEVFFRTKLETLTNLATGTSTSVVGRAVSKAQEKAGLVPTYTVEQLRDIERLAESMGGDNRFLAVVYDEMTYRNMVEAGRGRVGSKLESFAAFSARATSDPHFGMLAKSTSKRYIEAALEYMQSTDNVVPFDVMMREMNLDSLWLEKNFRTDRFTPHRAGLNRIAQTRSIKASVPSKLIMGGIDRLTVHDKWALNAAGHLLKIPLLFTRFNSNALITMTGLGGLDQMTAMFLDQRQNAVKALMRGDQFDPAADRIDMTDIIEGANLFRPFVKGAITQTGLMTFGMMAGGLGLSGEDEETKRRRRLATYLGTPYYYDPRRVENDFRYADAQFLDWMPDGLESLFEVGDTTGPDGERKVAQAHWIFRQFLSPVVGIERFLNTGDFRQVEWGFSDAFSVMPNSVSRLWTEAKMTADALSQSAREVDGVSQTNTAEGQALAQKLLISGVGIYEKALLENSFVNAIRNGLDDYDRNPWEAPDVTQLGEIKRDPVTGAPLPSTALEQTIDPRTGEPVVSYVERDAVDAYLHQYAENNLSAAVLLSLFTGQPGTDSTYFRQNMVPAQKSLTLPERGQAFDETVIMSALHGMIAKGEGYENLTQYEAEKAVWASKPEDEYWDSSRVTAMAQQIVARANAGGQTAGLTLLDAEGKEILNKEGARGVLTSLSKGLIDLDHPSLAGIHITVPMRQQIQDEWTDELVNEGLAMGLDEGTAQSRARRIWYGNTYEDPNAKGLRDLLWTDEIPWTGKVTYNQLNTTFVLGPDGRPWATPFERQNLLQALGIPLPTTPIRPAGGGLSRDSRGNVVDDVYGINTGLIALERVEDQGQLAPPEDEPKAFTEPRTKSDGGSGSGGSGWVDFGNGWTNYKKRGYTPYKRRSYSSSGGSSGYPNFTRMYGLPHGQSPYGNDIPFINTSNPILRRADVRRERVWSERGRLNQWQ